MFIVFAVRTLLVRDQRLRNLGIGFIYLTAAITSFLWINLNWKIADRHAEPVVAACDAYKAKFGNYPEQLQDLVPDFLPEIPRAGYTLASKNFFYRSSDPPSLYHAVMFHGVARYDLISHQWSTND